MQRLLLATAAMMAIGTASAAEPGPRQCAIWNRELAFAASVARHDAAAFAEFIDADAVFAISSERPLVGRAAIAKAWRDSVAGKSVRRRWYPTKVVMPPTDDIAWSNGPALLETIGTDGRMTATLGTYTAVWRRNADGEWRVVLEDAGVPQPATAAQVEAFVAGQTRHCNDD